VDLLFGRADCVVTMAMLGLRFLMIMLVLEFFVGYSCPSHSILTFQGEDGIGGFSDTHQYICTSFAFWNEKDKILKERLFGVTGHQGTSISFNLTSGNHGEDVKEMYFYLVHSYFSI
jgi:hypothetical protein